MSRLVLSCLVLSCLFLSCVFLSRLVFCLVVSCLVLSCLVLSCLVLLCLVLSCLFVLSYHISDRIWSVSSYLIFSLPRVTIKSVAVCLRWVACMLALLSHATALKSWISSARHVFCVSCHCQACFVVQASRVSLSCLDIHQAASAIKGERGDPSYMSATFHAHLWARGGERSETIEHESIFVLVLQLTVSKPH